MRDGPIRPSGCAPIAPCRIPRSGCSASRTPVPGPAPTAPGRRTCRRAPSCGRPAIRAVRTGWPTPSPTAWRSWRTTSRPPSPRGWAARSPWHSSATAWARSSPTRSPYGWSAPTTCGPFCSPSRPARARCRSATPVCICSTTRTSSPGPPAWASSRRPTPTPTRSCESCCCRHCGTTAGCWRTIRPSPSSRCGRPFWPSPGGTTGRARAP